MEGFDLIVAVVVNVLSQLTRLCLKQLIKCKMFFLNALECKLYMIGLILEFNVTKTIDSICTASYNGSLL